MVIAEFFPIGLGGIMMKFNRPGASRDCIVEPTAGAHVFCGQTVPARDPAGLANARRGIYPDPGVAVGGRVFRMKEPQQTVCLITAVKHRIGVAGGIHGGFHMGHVGQRGTVSRKGEYEAVFAHQAIVIGLPRQAVLHFPAIDRICRIFVEIFEQNHLRAENGRFRFPDGETRVPGNRRIA